MPIVCIKCGHQNPDDARYCEKCGAVLPRISKNIARPVEAKITVHFDMIKDAVEKYRAGQMSLEDYLGVLDLIYNRIDNAAREIEEMEIPEDLLPVFKEQLDIGLTGMDLFLQAIEELRAMAEYIEATKDPETPPEEIPVLLEEADRLAQVGIELAAEATDHLNLALEMARENMRRWIEESEASGGYVV